MTFPPPRILLAEDDPVSRAFLSAALKAVPAVVDAADSLAAASALAAATRYDLWLFDAHLPDGSGTELLRRLRTRDADTPALAHTASDDAELTTALVSAGFREVLVKPLPAAAVRSAIRRVLALSGDEGTYPSSAHSEAQAVWDDEAAARALNGNREHIASLRSLFLAELPGIGERVAASVRNGNAEQVRAELHRLRASCGFVGATRLGWAARELHDDTHSPLKLLGFEIALRGYTTP